MAEWLAEVWARLSAEPLFLILAGVLGLIAIRSSRLLPPGPTDRGSAVVRARRTVRHLIKEYLALLRQPNSQPAWNFLLVATVAAPPILVAISFILGGTVGTLLDAFLDYTLQSDDLDLRIFVLLINGGIAVPWTISKSVSHIGDFRL